MLCEIAIQSASPFKAGLPQETFSTVDVTIQTSGQDRLVAIRAEEIKMQRIVVATLFGMAIAGPAAAQGPNVQQLLQGLTTGNKGQDQALHDAFERGYQRGHQDGERQARSERGGSDRSYRGDGDERRADQPYGRQDGSSDR